MRRLLPPPSVDRGSGDGPGADLDASYRVARPAPTGRPWVVANMVASADGATALEGRSEGLAGPADKEVFRLLRSLADVVVAGAGTVRTEGYRPIVAPSPTPIAIVTRTLDLDWSSPLFAGPPARTIVLTCEAAPEERRRRAEAVADVVVCGDDGVELAAAFGALAERGHAVALCEGGPGLLAQVVAAGVLDELCLTIGPLLAGGDARRVLAGDVVDPPARLTLASAFEADGTLLLRYLVGPAADGEAAGPLREL